MKQKIKEALEAAREARDTAGRSEQGRLAALVATHLETALALAQYAEQVGS